MQRNQGLLGQQVEQLHTFASGLDRKDSDHRDSDRKDSADILGIGTRLLAVGNQLAPAVGSRVDLAFSAPQ